MKKIKLLCIPYAGASSVIYHRWRTQFAAPIEMKALELRGRGYRMEESLLHSMDEAVHDLYEVVKEEAQSGEIALFGHSMGGYMSYLIALRMEQEKLPLRHLFLSGMRAPQVQRDQSTHTLEEEAFIARILDMGGTPKEVFADPELKAMFLPLLRADYHVVDSFDHHADHPQLQTPLTIFNGSDDEAKTLNTEIWQAVAEQYEMVTYEGDHFFLNEKKDDMIAYITRKLQTGAPQRMLFT
ncbi:thioesterase II family protein [Marinicrinis sediminis]|uniref:Thioesterase II family protein n=1 Tax=Marinicrinis sediminis TaxID=1652465 RepID=A0ABW5R617_9BACL